MSKILAVAWREFKYTALTRTFIISAVIFPVGMWVAMPLIVLLTQERVPPLEGTIAVVDTTGEVLAAFEFELSEARRAEEASARADALRKTTDRIKDDPVGAMTDTDLAATIAGETFPLDLKVLGVSQRDDALEARVRRGELVAIVEVDPAVLDVTPVTAEPAGDPPGLTVFATPDIRPDHSRLINRKLAAAVIRARAARAGEDVAVLQAIVKRPPIKGIALREGGVKKDQQTDLKEILPIAFMVLLTICAFTGGQYLLTSTIEEKSNRVMEVLLSAVSPMQLMTGKIIGQGLVGLVMLGMYGALGVAALVYFASTDLITPFQFACLFAFFVIAYFFTAAVMASIGSAVSDMHDAQALMFPAVMVLLMLPMMLMFPASQNPNGTLATATSFIPPFIPYVMIVRVMSDEVPLWQVLASIVVGAGSVAAALWLAAKIFRVGVLMYGKPPTPLELLRWARY